MQMSSTANSKQSGEFLLQITYQKWAPTLHASHVIASGEVSTHLPGTPIVRGHKTVFKTVPLNSVNKSYAFVLRMRFHLN